MTDLVAQLVGALEAADFALAIKGIREDGSTRGQIRSALSAAKDGGWVAVPGEPTSEMLAAGETAYWQKVRDVQSPTPTEFYDECGGPIGYAWIAMLAARPLPNPPKGEV